MEKKKRGCFISLITIYNLVLSPKKVEAQSEQMDGRGEGEGENGAKVQLHVFVVESGHRCTVTVMDWSINATGGVDSVGSALRFPVHVLHVHLEVVVAGELLVAQLTLCHGPVGVVGELVPAEHLLQAERQVAHLPHTHRKSTPSLAAATGGRRERHHHK